MRPRCHAVCASDLCPGTCRAAVAPYAGPQISRAVPSRLPQWSPLDRHRRTTVARSTFRTARTPNAQMSARLSTGLPRACSGDIYAAVPRMTPRLRHGRRRYGRRMAHAARHSRRFHRFGEPEVQHLHRVVGRTLMFAGFRSRWMIPCSCAASSASAICLAIGSASSSGIGPAQCDRASVRALDQLHHEGGRCPRSLQAIDRRDVRMIQRRQHFGFALEPRQPLRFGCDRVRQHLDRNRRASGSCRVAR